MFAYIQQTDALSSMYIERIVDSDGVKTKQIRVYKTINFFLNHCK